VNKIILALAVASVCLWFSENRIEVLYMSILASIAYTVSDFIYLKFSYLIFSAMRFLIPVLIISSLGNNNGVLKIYDFISGFGFYIVFLSLYRERYRQNQRH
jgi:hypothetical protein